jgi:hypothetical protein
MAGSVDSVNKHCLKTLLETLLNSVSNDLLPFVVGQSHDSYPLMSVKDVLLCQHCQQATQVLCMRYRQDIIWSKPGCKVTCFCVQEWVTSLKKRKYYTVATLSSVNLSWFCRVRKGGKSICGFLLLLIQEIVIWINCRICCTNDIGFTLIRQDFFTGNWLKHCDLIFWCLLYC